MDWLYSLSGFLVGLIVGVTGVGGGSLMTPLLVLVFGVAPVTAVGTDLLFAALTKTGGAWAHARRGNVAWNVVGWPAISIPAGTTDSGLPIGAQLLGPEGGEAVLLELAGSVERSLGGWERAPYPRRDT